MSRLYGLYTHFGHHEFAIAFHDTFLLHSLRSARICMLMLLHTFIYFTEQITEALTYLHHSGHVIHRNVCPQSIYITKKGTWKLGGLGFIRKCLQQQQQQ